MATTSAGLRGRIQGIARRYPLDRYGWARAVRYGRIEQHGQGLIVVPKSTDDCFDCFSSSLALRDELTREGLQADTYQVKIAVSGEEPVYTHAITMIDLGDKIVVSGFSPFEILLGCFTEREMTREECGRFAGRLQGEICRRLVDRDDDDLPEGSLFVRKSWRPRYYPFAFQAGEGGGVLSEFSHWYESGQGGFLALRVSRLAFNQEAVSLERLSSLSFRICFPHFYQASSFANPETSERGHDPQLREAVPAFWPDFIKLAEALNATLYR